MAAGDEHSAPLKVKYVPPMAAAVAVSDTEIAIPEDSQGCIVGCFLENTFLWND